MYPYIYRAMSVTSNPSFSVLATLHLYYSKIIPSCNLVINKLAFKMFLSLDLREWPFNTGGGVGKDSENFVGGSKKFTIWDDSISKFSLHTLIQNIENGCLK